VTAAEQSVAAAYLLVVVLVLVYVLIVAAKLQRLGRAIQDLSLTPEELPNAPTPEELPAAVSRRGRLGAVEAHPR
jgi:hypothetical protein